ncbi:MAG: hypothetical protein V1778_02055 [bacterium]
MTLFGVGVWWQYEWSWVHTGRDIPGESEERRMGRTLKTLIALGGIAASRKCQEDGDDFGTVLFGAIGLGTAISLLKELEEEEQAKREEEERQEEKARRDAEWRWERDHVCIGCGEEFDDKLPYDRRCSSCWASWDASMDDD